MSNVDRDTVAALVEQFARRHLTTLKRGGEVHSALRRYVVSEWGDRDVHTVAKRDVTDLLDSIVEDGKATTANRVRAHLSKFFGWLAERDVIDASPVGGVKAPAKEKSRDRVLSDEEIPWFWRACDDLGQPWGPLGKVLLLTGQRLGEVVAMTDAEIDGDTWHLTAYRTKNGRAHDVPLSGAVRGVLVAVERIDGAPGYTTPPTAQRLSAAISRAAIALPNAWHRLPATNTASRWKSRIGRFTICAARLQRAWRGLASPCE